MAGVKDSLLDLERHRLQLENNIEQLRKALQHWQTWDAEYEALKEEIEAAPNSPRKQKEELVRIHREYEGELLRGKELDEIFGLQASRSREHIVNVLQRRIDYVTKNVESLQKQLATLEAKHAVAAAANHPDTLNENGEPFTEIIEELDDDDNVLSYHLNRPGDSMPHVLETLEKAGIKEKPADGPEHKQPAVEPSTERNESQSDPMVLSSPSEPDEASSEAAEVSKGTVPSSNSMDTDNTSVSTAPHDVSRKAKRVERIMKTAREQEGISKQAPVIPEDEEPEDAALRRQMLQYSMGEVGAVVAELELEENTTDDGEVFDYDDDFDDLDGDADEDDEDRHGRSTGRTVTDRYRQRMLELEKKLGVTSRFTQAVGDGESSGSDDDEGIGRIVVKKSTEATPSSSKPAPLRSSLKDRQSDADVKKGVRFARNLDVASDQERVAVPEKRGEPVIDPLSDIVERSSPTSGRKPSTEPGMRQKPSRFRKGRDRDTSSGDSSQFSVQVPLRLTEQEVRASPTGPDGKTLADQLVERAPSLNAPPPNELDEFANYGAVASEYQRLRKKFIQRQGGFLQEDTSPVQELDSSEASEPISRFKAARLSRQ